jgi:hypothetical protein
VANDYADALDAIEDTKEKLTDTVVLAGSLFAGFTEKAIGTVDLSLSSGSFVDIVSSTTAAGDVIELPSDPGVTTILDVTLQPMGGTSVFNSGASFTLEVSASTNRLTLKDTDASGSNDKIGVLEFTKYKIGNSGITTPELTDVFYVGVKSRRP